MSVANPQQWSESPGHAQALVQYTCLILPGQAAMIFVAPLTALALQAPTAGTLGEEYPPKPVAPEEQHMNALGPGHWLETVDPAQSLVHRQLPDEPLEQLALVQHLMSAASHGHAPLIVVPPAELQVLVETQTPVRRRVSLLHLLV